jgi:glycosyltransferase involved in cell wall biosynthesis
MTALRVSMFHTIGSEDRISMEVYARELANALRREGVEVVDVWPPAGAATKNNVTGLAHARAYFDRYARYQFRAARAGSEVNHIPDHGYGHLAYHLDPRRTVVTFHDAMLLKLEAGELASQRLPRATIAGHRFSLRAIRRVARVITPSKSARDDFLRFQDYPPERVISIPEGVSASFQPRPGRKDSWPPENQSPVILHVGHTGFYKNIESILRAIPIVQRRLEREVRFRKVGGRFTAAQEKLISSLGIANNIEHLGTLPEDELVRAYADSDVLLMPSLHEGFGLPVLEAMASAVPVVASNRGSLPEVVGDAGLLVEPQDLEAISDAVVRALTDPILRADLVARGLERASQFTWERTARATLDVYRAVSAEAG